MNEFQLIFCCLVYFFQVCSLICFEVVESWQRRSFGSGTALLTGEMCF